MSLLEEYQEVYPPIASLMSKSEKALQKLTADSWQHTMLRDNIKALKIASTMMQNENLDWTQNELQDALRALAVMVDKTEKALGKFHEKTSQHSLLRNRFHALRTAARLLQEKRGELSE